MTGTAGPSGYETLMRATKTFGKDALKSGASALAFVLPGDVQKKVAKKLHGDAQDVPYLAFKSGVTETLLGYAALIGSTVLASPAVYAIGAYAVFEGLGRTVIASLEKEVYGPLAIEVPYQVAKKLKNYLDNAKEELVNLDAYVG